MHGENKKYLEIDFYRVGWLITESADKDGEYISVGNVDESNSEQPDIKIFIAPGMKRGNVLSALKKIRKWIETSDEYYDAVADFYVKAKEDEEFSKQWGEDHKEIRDC